MAKLGDHPSYQSMRKHMEEMNDLPMPRVRPHDAGAGAKPNRRAAKPAKSRGRMEEGAGSSHDYSFMRKKDAYS